MNFTRRPASIEDEAFVRQLILQMVSDDLGAALWPEAMRAPLLEMQYRGRLDSIRVNWPDAEQEIILTDGQPAGWVVIAHCEDAIHLVEIAILPEHRGKGVGTGRIRELLTESDRTGKPVRLNVLTTNPANRLYERLGFRRTGGDEIRHFMERPSGAAPPGRRRASARRAAPKRGGRPEGLPH